MRIYQYIKPFIRSTYRYDKDMEREAENLLLGGQKHSLGEQDGKYDLDSLADDIKDSVRIKTRGKDTAIYIYKGFVEYLKRKGIEIQVTFPPVPIDNTFERLMFIAKYLQSNDGETSKLDDILWISKRTVDQDLARLRGDVDPIQICGRPFKVNETSRENGHMEFASTVHPFFLTENLTQVMIILEGLRTMSENPIYKHYALFSASDIWEQLSDYAKKRICFVLEELRPTDLDWFESLEKIDSKRFSTEKECGVFQNVFLECTKNGKPFCLEYNDNGKTIFYSNCLYVWGAQKTEEERGYPIECDQGYVMINPDNIVRSAYTIEELIAE